MRKQILAGNWKMYKSSTEAKEFIAVLSKQIPSKKRLDLVIFPQAPLLSVLQNHGKDAPSLHWGPQNLHWEEKGAFTGEISPLLAKEFGCTYALSGHSERRQFFGETSESAVKRAAAAHAHGMRPMLCVGESLAERDAGKTFAVLKEQLAPLFKGGLVSSLVVAYEPVWAIGTGRNATAEQAQEAHHSIRQEFASHWGQGFADSLPILYGGSVKPENASGILGQPDVDGALVGGASLDPSSFLAIAASCKEC